MNRATAASRFENKPYLQCLETLENAFPALKTFLEKLANEKEAGRAAVHQYYKTTENRVPGRCYCLKFTEKDVSIVQEGGFESPATLRTYLETHPATQSRQDKERRLFILEDMEPDYVDALGHHLGVDPLVFSEQMNTWNFTDSWSIPHRGLPSMSIPGQSFTLRYYELRTLFDSKSVDISSLQMSFAINRRRYERWRDIDIPSSGVPDRRHAFVRRCASFWTSQDMTPSGSGNSLGWDAVILVDPPFAVTCGAPREGLFSAPTTLSKTAPHMFTPDGIELDDSAVQSLEECSILKTPKTYANRASLWKAQGWKKFDSLERKEHISWPYHDGCPTLAPLVFSQIGIGAKEANIRTFQTRRNLNSAMDEMVFYWTKLATPELLMETQEKSSNAAFYLLKHVAQHWVNQLEMTNTTITKAEWFSEDYQARMDDNISRRKWKAELVKINEIAKDINYMRQQLNHFWRAMYLNLERLGVQLGCESVDENASLAIKDAQKDFITIHARMQPLRNRAEALTSVSNDIANLRTAFRGVADGEFSLRLSLFASVVFPLTLLAGIFSMGDDYRPGRPQFWKLWAIGVPFCVTVALGLVYGKHPWTVFIDLWEYAGDWVKRRGLVQSRAHENSFEKVTGEEQSGSAAKNRPYAEKKSLKRAAYKADEEQAVIA
ncbi:hypothetical protein HBI24_075320 [Parastagonospora nodorum]|nr:hypothetical protein HBH53_148540 [Parastagonospora nodorum]KAH3966871.1 hypothetical protein HBH51_139950 [Parastagonospora nodorum]KAH4026917.1 hypothetical protein HBI09_145770 [Parastagonospora nodorum]KAH4088613.1 hypothetical protein HBH46_195340 [Parastagonospora nodorum]KAH5004160.1 hypothetical protein HBI77_124930 [Parastagonospora nodorum]